MVSSFFLKLCVLFYSKTLQSPFHPLNFLNLVCIGIFFCSPVHFSSVTQSCLFAIPWITAHKATLSITNSWSLTKLMSIESVMPSNHLILCHPLLLLASIFPSIRVFTNESKLHIKWPKYWIFSFNICPSTKHPGLISFRMNWLDLLAVKGSLKSLLHPPGKSEKEKYCIISLIHGI